MGATLNKLHLVLQLITCTVLGTMLSITAIIKHGCSNRRTHVENK